MPSDFFDSPILITTSPATDAGPQYIDTFDPAAVSSIHYDIQVTSDSLIYDIKLDVTHNGYSTSEYQVGFSDTNTAPMEIITNIFGNSGYIIAQPPTNDGVVTFKMVRSDIKTDLYGDNMKSGRAILGNTGFGVSFAGANSTSTVRQSSNNQWTKGVAFYGTEIEQLPYVSSNTWISYNNSVLTYDTNYTYITSSSYNENYQYQEIDVVVGKVYALNIIGEYTPPDPILAKQENTSSVGIPAIKIGHTRGGADLFNYQFEQYGGGVTPAIFVPTKDKIYVSIGYGKLNSVVKLTDFYIIEVSPFNTYDQHKGTMYLSWSALPINSNLVSFSTVDGRTQTISISSSNTVIITQNTAVVNSGIQLLTNKLAFVYSNTGIIASLNGNSVIDSTILPLTTVTTVDINTSASIFSYVPEVLIEADIIEITA
jgi:hypothetical protein